MKKILITIFAIIVSVSLLGQTTSVFADEISEDINGELNAPVGIETEDPGYQEDVDLFAEDLAETEEVSEQDQDAEGFSVNAPEAASEEEADDQQAEEDPEITEIEVEDPEIAEIEVEDPEAVSSDSEEELLEEELSDELNDSDDTQEEEPVITLAEEDLSDVMKLVSAIPSAKCVRGKVKLTWNKVSNSKGYIIYRRLPGNSWVKLGKSTATAFTDSTAAAGKTYEYGVKAYTTVNNITVVSSLNAKSIVKINVPVKVAVTAASNVSTGVKVTWSAGKNAVAYNVFRKIAGNSWKLIKKVSSTSYTDKNVTAGTKYSYKVTVCDKYGNEGASGTNKSYVFLPCTTVKKLTNNGSYAKLTWARTEGASGYRVYRKLASDTSFKKLADVTDAAYYKDYSNGYGKKYIYLVRPYVKLGKSTYFGSSATASQAAIVRFQTPKILVEQYEVNKGFNVSWTMIQGATRYTLYRYCEAEGWIKLKGLTATYFIDKTASKGTQYRYKVVANKGEYQSAPAVSKYYKLPSSIDLPSSRRINLGWDVDPRRTGGPAYYDSYATDYTGKRVVNLNVWSNHNTIYGSNYKPHAGDIICYGQEDENGRVYQHVDICVSTYDSSTGTFGVISGNWGSWYETSPIAYVTKSWSAYTQNKGAYNTIHNIWQCKLSDNKRAALINSAYRMLDAYNENPDYVRNQILDSMWIGHNNWCDVFVAYTIYIAQ